MGLFTDQSANRAVDDAGNPIPRAKRYFYAAGTASLRPIYRDLGLTHMQANPMTADENGYFEMCYLLEGSYKVVIETENGRPFLTSDNLTVGATLSLGVAQGFRHVAEILADTTLQYQSGTGHVRVEVNDLIRVACGGFMYQIASPIVSDHDLITEGGLKLYIQPAGGAIDLTACNPSTNTETVEASVDNQTAVSAAINAAVRSGCESVRLPAGTIWIKADNGVSTGSGLRINLPDGVKVRFLGQSGSVIKRLAAPVLASTSGLVFLSANVGIEVEWHDVTFDGNEANCAFDAENPYAEEQSANIKWLTGTGTPKALRFFGCDVGKNRVGDGYHANIRVDRFLATNCTTSDAAVRRTRADWQFSRFATYGTTMTNIDCNSWESEPSATQETARLVLANVLSRSVFDLAGDTGGAIARPVKVQLTNVTCDGAEGLAGLPFCNFYRVHGDAVNCNFRRINRIQRCKMNFRGGSVTVTDNGSGAADAVQVWHDQATETYATFEDRFGNFTAFDGVEFRKDASVNTGKYVTVSTTATTSGQLGDEMVRLSLTNCHVPAPLDHVVVAGRAGLLEIRGGALQANTGIVQYFNTAGFYSRLVVEANTNWNAPAMLDLDYGISFVGTELQISGAINAEIMQPIDSANVAMAPDAKWQVDAIAHVDSNPQGRIKTIPGLTAKVANPPAGSAVTYRASYASGDASGYGGTVWARLDGAVLSGPANFRPVLASNERGAVFLDTGLSAGGQPIWWNGSAWIDSVGSLV